MNSNKVCIDASLVLTWLLSTEPDEKIDSLWREWLERGIEFMVPPLFHAEVASVIREQVYFKRILPEEGEEAFSIYEEIPVTGVGTPDVYRKAWELAREFNLPRTYDMQYLAVAELEDCELWTSDKSLVNSLKHRDKRIRWVGKV